MPLLRGPDGPLENDGPSHGRDTAIYQELLPVAAAFDKWLASNQNEFWCPEDEEKALGDPRDAKILQKAIEDIRAGKGGVLI